MVGTHGPVLQLYERKQPISEVTRGLEVFFADQQAMQSSRQFGRHHRQATNPAIGSHCYGFKCYHVNARKDGKIETAEEACIVNPTDLQVGPFHGMDNILISQHCNFLGSELDPDQQRDIVHHDGQANFLADSAEVIQHVPLGGRSSSGGMSMSPLQPSDFACKLNSTVVAVL